MSTDPNKLAQELVAGIADLPTLPEVYLRVRSVLQDPAASHRELADAVGSDPAIAARLLKMANSAFYGRPGAIDTIGRAIGLLGTQQVHDLVLATVLIDSFRGTCPAPLEPRAFWHASLFSGVAAKLLAEHCGILDCERLFVAGLLAQVGQLLACRGREATMKQLLEEARQDALPLDRLQREHLGFDYAAVGAALFERWQLPRELVDPIRWHTDPAAAGDNMLEAAILHVAVRMATAPAGDPDALLRSLDDCAWRATELTTDVLAAIEAEATTLTAGLAPLMLDEAA